MFLGITGYQLATALISKVTVDSLPKQPEPQLFHL